MAESYNIPYPIANISCQELLENHCTHCGWLRKKRMTLKLFSWPQAYVVLRDGCLYYFKHERARSAAGNFSLYGYNAVYRATEIPSREAQWCLKIIHSHKEFKTYYFAASSEQEMKIWMNSIKKEMLHANGKSEVYGKTLQFVREEPSDDQKFLDDPSFYQQIEENIYDDNEFVPSKDYQKKCSIKKENEDSDDDDLPDTKVLDDRQPLQTPTHEPFITIIPHHKHTPLGPTNSSPLPPTSAPPSKPPRIVDNVAPPNSRFQDNIVNSASARIHDNKPPTPPRRHREPQPLPVSPMPSKDLPSPDRPEQGTPVSAMIQQLQKQFDGNNAPKGFQSNRTPRTQNRRRGSYEPTDDSGAVNPQVPSRPVPNHSGGGGSTGSEEFSDPEEDRSAFYYDSQDKEKASNIITALGENGVYLVRPENNGNGKVLVVFAFDQCKKYRIKYQDGQYFLAKEGHHDPSLESLLKFYKENNLPTVNVKLRRPFRLHPNFKDLNME